MYQVRLEGTYYEMGCQQGELMKGRAVPYVWLESCQGNVDPGRREFADACEKIVGHYMPDFLQELHGVADTVDIDYDKVKIWPLCSYAKLQQSCSAVAISGQYTVQGRPLFIRNYDFLDSDGKDFTVFRTRPRNGYASVGFSDAMSGRYCGFNEKGLTVASSISGYAGPTQPGVAFSLVTRWVLDHCSKIDEAVEFFRDIPHFHGWNFLLCDLRSNIVRVETSPERVEVVSFDEGIGVSTNHYLSEAMQKLEEKNWRSEGSSIRRHANAIQWFRSRHRLVDLEYARRLAKSRVDEGGLCDRFVGVEGGTLWSWIHAAGDPTFLVSDGPPCKCTYQELDAL
jgi:predicted choloylglycine hydrolase